MILSGCWRIKYCTHRVCKTCSITFYLRLYINYFLTFKILVGHCITKYNFLVIFESKAQVAAGIGSCFLVGAYFTILLTVSIGIFLIIRQVLHQQWIIAKMFRIIKSLARLLVLVTFTDNFCCEKETACDNLFH